MVSGLGCLWLRFPEAEKIIRTKEKACYEFYLNAFNKRRRELEREALLQHERELVEIRKSMLKELREDLEWRIEYETKRSELKLEIKLEINLEKIKERLNRKMKFDYGAAKRKKRDELLEESEKDRLIRYEKDVVAIRKSMLKELEEERQIAAKKIAEWEKNNPELMKWKSAHGVPFEGASHLYGGARERRRLRERLFKDTREKN